MKNLLISIRSTSGRNSHGHLTCKRKGGGLKKKYSIVDLKRNYFNVPAVVLSEKYDSFRTCFLSLVLYKNGFLSYILKPRTLRITDTIFSSNHGFWYKQGDNLPVYCLKIGTLIHNLEFYPNFGGKLLRSAGVYGKIWRQEYPYTVIKLRSGEERVFYGQCRATVGVLCNENHHLFKYYKAGTLRNLGVRPTVRGVAMNPVDHPNGGRTKGGAPFTDKWGNLSKGGRSGRFNKSRFVLKSRYKVKYKYK